MWSDLISSLISHGLVHFLSLRIKHYPRFLLILFRRKNSVFVFSIFVRFKRPTIKCIVSQSVQSLSRVRLFSTPWIAARQASLSITNSRSLLKPMPIESVMQSSHLILCHPLFLLPPIPPSIRVFSNESTLCIRWPKYNNFTFSISPSSEHPGLLSFRMDWLDLLEVQGTLKSLLQHHSSQASIFRCSTFFAVQLSHPYMTAGKTLTRRTFVGKVMSLLFNTLSRVVITFLPRSVGLNWEKFKERFLLSASLPLSIMKLYFYWITLTYNIV